MRNTKKVKIIDDAKQKIKFSVFVKNKKREVELKDVQETSFLQFKKKYSLENIELGAIVNKEPICIYFGLGNFWVTAKSTLDYAKKNAIQESFLN